MLLEDLINGDIFMQDLLSGCHRLKQQVIFVDKILDWFLQDMPPVQPSFQPSNLFVTRN